MLWESDVLPARLHGYAPPWLDRAMQSSALMWVGRQRQQVAFYHADDLDLMMDGDRDKGDDGADDTDEASAVIRRFPDNRGRYSLSDLLNDPTDTPNRALQELWAGVWAGKVTNDTAMALRQGIAQGFKPGGQPRENALARLSMGRPRRYRRRSAGRLSAGSVGNCPAGWSRHTWYIWEAGWRWPPGARGSRWISICPLRINVWAIVSGYSTIFWIARLTL